MEKSKKDKPQTPLSRFLERKNPVEVFTTTNRPTNLLYKSDIEGKEELS